MSAKTVNSIGSSGHSLQGSLRRAGDSCREILVDMGDRQQFTREWQLAGRGPGALPRGGGGAWRERGPVRVVRNDLLDSDLDPVESRFSLDFLLAAPRRWTEQLFAWVESQGR